MIKLKTNISLPDYRLNAIKSFNDLEYLTPEQSSKLELSIYNYTVDFCNAKNIKLINPKFQNIYKNKLIHILLNIDNKSYINNQYLYKKIIDGKIDIEQIINLEPREMAPDKWSFHDKIEEINISSIIQGNSTLHKSKLYKCSRCKNNDTEYTESQTRSADEPTTFFITCRCCGKKWVQ